MCHTLALKGWTGDTRQQGSHCSPPKDLCHKSVSPLLFYCSCTLIVMTSHLPQVCTVIQLIGQSLGISGFSHKYKCVHYIVRWIKAFPFLININLSGEFLLQVQRSHAMCGSGCHMLWQDRSHSSRLSFTWTVDTQQLNNRKNDVPQSAAAQKTEWKTKCCRNHKSCFRTKKLEDNFINLPQTLNKTVVNWPNWLHPPPAFRITFHETAVRILRQKQVQYGTISFSYRLSKHCLLQKAHIEVSLSNWMNVLAYAEDTNRSSFTNRIIV